MPKICSPHNPEPIARAFVQAVRGRLAALPFLPEVERIEVDIDLTPITSRIHGELRASSKGENNGRQVWISAFNFSDCWRTRLFPGFKFKLFQSKYREIAGEQAIGLGIIEVVLPSLCRYEADAEVELYVEASAQSVSSLSGELFDFIFPKIGRTYYGHWDDKDFLMDSDRKRRTGNAFLCFHNLTLSQKNPSPGGRPLSRCDEFIIMKQDVLVGRGGVTRVLPTTPVIGIRHPTITGQLKTETSFV